MTILGAFVYRNSTVDFSGVVWKRWCSIERLRKGECEVEMYTWSGTREATSAGNVVRVLLKLGFKNRGAMAGKSRGKPREGDIVGDESEVEAGVGGRNL